MHMKYLEKMIASETIPNAFEDWSKYRAELTGFIEEVCPTSENTKPTLAIWGAGQSNDIDLGKLDKSYRLVLIDRDTEALKQACEKYALDAAQVKCVDIPFWNVEMETYELFEALLAEGAETEVLLELLEQVAFTNNHAIQPILQQPFDYSICVGLHSQLNARFAGLLYMYRENLDAESLRMVEQAIRALNQAAVERLNDIVYLMTKRTMLFGLEWAVVNETTQEQWRNMPVEDIEGACQLRQDIGLHKDFDIRIEAATRLFWPFAWQEKKKGYVMELLAVLPVS